MCDSLWKPLSGDRGPLRWGLGLLVGLTFWIMIEVGKGSFAEEFVYEKKGRDPFWPLVTEGGKVLQGFAVATFEDIYLEGILWDSKGDSLAMINGMILRRGDRIGEFEIMKIEETQVHLQSGNEHHLLKVEKNF